MCIGWVDKENGIDCICITKSYLHRLNMTEVITLRACKKPHEEDEAIDYVFGLLDIPWWYYAIAVLLCVAVWRIWKKPSLGLLIGYSFLILTETVLIRKPFIGEHIKLELFWSWRVWAVQKEQILTNVIMFVPVGVLGGWLWKWKGLFVGAGLSCVVELLQLVTSRGLCEFDDVIHNAVGTAVGVGIVVGFKKVVCRVS